MDQFNSHPLYRKHDLDSVMSSLFSFYKKHFLVLFLAAFAGNLASQFLTTSFDISKLVGLTDPFEIMAEFKTWLWPMVGLMVISLLLSLTLQYFIIYKPVSSEVNIFNSIYKSLKYLLPYIVIGIIFIFFMTIAIIAGLIVFIIGVLFSVLYVFMISLFILPTLMAEGNNIGNALGRTFTLSHRHFGSNLGWTAIIFLIIMVGSLILSSLVMIPFSVNFYKILTNPAEATEALSFMTNPWFIILSALAGSVFQPLTPILGAILYFNAKAREDDAMTPVEGTGETDKIKVEDLYPGNSEKKEN
ncbi:MAG: hypothetical protein MUF36_12870 [Bacteroidales bacterium]|nr:hypothetical protein [Bacteroidales bacterium]